MKIYLDDERKTPDGWHRSYWPDEVIELLKTQDVSVVSLDHDLGDDERGTGYDVISWIEEAVVMRGYIPPEIRVHSANPAARQRMEHGIASIQKQNDKIADMQTQVTEGLESGEGKKSMNDLLDEARSKQT
nr:cyclic-phosphate processing receiver domain-containing protein [Kordiimonas aquimaris]